MSYSAEISIRDYQCSSYTFTFLLKGVQIFFEKNQNTTKQFILFSQLQSVRLDYLHEERVSVITLLLHDSLKYSYSVKSFTEAESIYEKFLAALNS